MKKIVTVDKMSKKDRKAYYAAQRRDWGNATPLLREFPDKSKFCKSARSREKAVLHSQV